MSYFFANFFVPFYGLCIRCFGVLGQPGVAIDPSNAFLWFDLAILMIDVVCMVYVMDFARRYANGQNYSKLVEYVKGILQKILFLHVLDTEKNPMIKYYNLYRNCMVALMTLVTYGLQSMPWVLLSINIMIVGAWTVTIIRVNFFKSVVMYWWNMLHVFLLL
jgi:hypothetical protein